MAHKGRHFKSQINAERAKRIRALKKQGFKQVDIARQFGVSRAVIGRVVRGESFRTDRECGDG
jgi:transcriptional regulator with XRE-family HTH domain